MKKSDFIARVADPLKLEFKGKCYDAGADRQTCTCCRRSIRQVFMLKDQSGTKFYIGSGCIDHLKRWNRPLWVKLDAARTWLHTWIQQEVKATRAAHKVNSLRVSEQKYAAIKKEAAAAIREYHRTTGKQWLPEHLFVLQNLLNAPKPTLKPDSRSRWFERRAEEMKRYFLPTS